MGICQSRPKPKDATKSDKSVLSGSGASASTVAISNSRKKLAVVGKKKDDWKLENIRESQAAAATTTGESGIDTAPQNRVERLSPLRTRTDESERKEEDVNVVPMTPPTQDSDVEPRRLWFSSSQSKQKKRDPDDDDDDDDEDLEEDVGADCFENTEAFSDGGTMENNGKKSSKRQQMGFSPIRTSIPEEKDPEMPSDEEDFREDLRRQVISKDEPGRLLPVKLRSQPTTTVNSVTPPTNETHPPGIDPGDMSSVNHRALSDFQRLKLQVKLQRHQEMKDRRVTKVEEKVNDADANKKLWQEYQQAKQEATEMEHDTNLTKTRALHQRSDSFDLQDSKSWYFDFQAGHVQVLPDEGDDDASNANCSLLSEQSLDAQRRYYAEKRRMRKEKKKQSKLERRLQKDGPIVRADAGVLSAGDASRLNMNNSVGSGITRDYGPVRDTPAPLQLEVSFPLADGYNSDQNDNNKDETGSYVGSYVSDLGDESYTGGGAWGGSHAGQSYSHYSYGSASNDYGVKRRMRRSDYSGQYGNKEKESIQSKLTALEQAVARFQKEAEEEEVEETPQVGAINTKGVHGVDSAPTILSSKALSALPLEQLVDRFERAQLSPDKDESVQESFRIVGKASDATTPTKTTSARMPLSPPSTTRISSKPEIKKDQQTKPSTITATLTPKATSESLKNAQGSDKSEAAFLRTSTAPLHTASSTTPAKSNLITLLNRHAAQEPPAYCLDDDDSVATGPAPRPVEQVPKSFQLGPAPAIEEEKKENDSDSSPERVSAVNSTLSQREKISSLLKARRSSRPVKYETPPPSTDKGTSSFATEDLFKFIPERTNATPDDSVPENRASGASFWTEDLFKFIPERTNVSPDETDVTPSMKRAVVTPGTTATDFTTPLKGEEAQDSEDDNNSPEEALAKMILGRSLQQETPFQPDPDGRRIDASESLRLACEVEAQVTQVLTNFRS